MKNKRGGKTDKFRIHEIEVRKALKHFRAQGGLVQRLPAEKVPLQKLVGIKHGMYENPMEISMNWGSQNNFF